MADRARPPYRKRHPMPRLGRIRALLTALLATLLVATASAQIDLPFDAIEVGRRGYGLTAGPGNVLERFEVEVLGIQVDPGLGFPLVLVRASGPIIDASGGVAAGMSGSPVYVVEEGGDALVGAIAYVFPEGDLSLALVTPIAAMRATIAGAPTLPTVFAERGRTAPVATPILLSGLGVRASTHLAPLFPSETVQLLPVQMAVISEADEEAYRLEPGSAVSVQLARGDITIAAVGTVTTLGRGEVLAFGHPLLGSGEVSFPLATAFVAYIVPSRVVPFKLSNSGRRLLGVITQDRPAAIGGSLDADADMLPVTLTVNHAGGSQVLEFEVVRDDRYHPALLAAAAQQALDEALDRTGAGSADLAWEIGLADGDSVRILEQVASERDIAAAAARLAAAPMALLATNIFEAPDLERLALSITVNDTLRVAELVEVAPSRTTVRPGETLEVFIRLQPYRREAEVRTLLLTVPEDAEGELRLLFRGGDVPRTGLEGAADDDDGLPPILSFAELLARLESNIQGSDLLVETVVAGDVRRLERLSTPEVVLGSKLITITIESASDEEDGGNGGSVEDAPPEADPDASDPEGTPDSEGAP
jgi:hypothetical protein